MMLKHHYRLCKRFPALDQLGGNNRDFLAKQKFKAKKNRRSGFFKDSCTYSMPITPLMM